MINLNEKMCRTRGTIAVPLDSQAKSLPTELLRQTYFFNVIAALTSFCRPTEAITLKTYATDYLKKSQNFTIDRSSADYI